MSDEWLTIDGSFGEGGGQIVRSAVALSCVTGRPIRVVRVRAKRKRPGLGHQHVTAVRAARQLCAAEVTGVQVGSTEFTFRPGPVQHGNYSFDVGTAGSTSLVLHTVVWPLLSVPGQSTVTVVGGTHNPLAPCFEFLDLVWARMLKRLGLHVRLSLLRHGFYPQGGGRIRAEIGGTNRFDSVRSLCLEARGEDPVVELWSYVARLPESIAERQARRAQKRLLAHGIEIDEIHQGAVHASCPGTYVFIWYRDSITCAGFQALGERGKRAERVADEAVDEFFQYLESAAAIDAHAGDQLILPLALARQPSSYTTARITQHLLTHAHLLQLFLGCNIEIEGEPDKPGRVCVTPAGSSTQA